jgi:hypothetical protein
VETSPVNGINIENDNFSDACNQMKKMKKKKKIDLYLLIVSSAYEAAYACRD